MKRRTGYTFVAPLIFLGTCPKSSTKGKKKNQKRRILKKMNQVTILSNQRRNEEKVRTHNLHKKNKKMKT